MAEARPTNVVPEEIASLLEKRTTLRDWLRAVDERRDDVRPDVFRRVRDDYRDRLTSVEESLANHRSDLARSLDEREGVVSDLEEQREVRAADLEEVELRHAVGEYDEEAWREQKAEHEEVLADLDERLDSERAAAGRLREVLDELEDLGAEPASAPAPGAGDGPGEPSDSTEPESGAPAGRSPAPPSAPAGAMREEAGEAPPPGAPESAAEAPAGSAADADPATSTEDVDREGDAGGSPAGGPDRASEAGTDAVSDRRQETEDALDFLENLSLEGVDFDSLDLDAEEERGGNEDADGEEDRD